MLTSSYSTSSAISSSSLAALGAANAFKSLFWGAENDAAASLLLFSALTLTIWTGVSDGIGLASTGGGLGGAKLPILKLGLNIASMQMNARSNCLVFLAFKQTERFEDLCANCNACPSHRIPKLSSRCFPPPNTSLLGSATPSPMLAPLHSRPLPL
jgi:hypothetical protein